MAGFLIPFGQMLGEAGAGIGQGKLLQDQAESTRINNQLGLQQLHDLQQQHEFMHALQSDPRFQKDPMFKMAVLSGDPGAIRAYISSSLKGAYNDQLLQSQISGIKALAEKARQSGDTDRASKLNDMADLMTAHIKEGAAGQVSGAMVNPVQGDIQQITDLMKRQELAKNNAAASEAAQYGFGPGPSPYNPPKLPSKMGASGVTPVTGVIEKTVNDLRSVGVPDATIAKYVNKTTGGKVSLEFPSSATGTSAGGATTAPSTKKSLKDLPMTDLPNLASNPYMSKAVAAEIARRKVLLPNASERKFLQQMVGSAQVGKNLEQAVAALPPIDDAGMLTLAHLYKSLGARGVPPVWQNYFTAIGAAYWAIYNSGSASGTKQGIGLLKAVADHFPTANQKFWPDLPSAALAKVRQLLTGSDESALMKQRDYLLKREFEANEGEHATFVTPEEEELISKHRSY